MLESPEIAHDIDKRAFEEQLPALRTDLLEAQFELVESRRFPVILVIAGMEGSGVFEALNGAGKVLDARHVGTFALSSPSDEEAERPRMWRFWRTLPPKGEMAVYAGSWYWDPLTERVLKQSSEADFEQKLQVINRFESMLAAEGALILKFWLHISKDEQEKRLKEFKSNHRTRWRIDESVWGGVKRYKQVKHAAEQMIRVTSKEHAPWIAVHTENPYHRNLVLGKTILNAIQARMAQAETQPMASASVSMPDPDEQTVLSSLDLSQHLEKSAYKKKLAKLQDRLNELLWSKKFSKHSVVLVFEGNDAAGKGGSIRRVTEFLDPRSYRVNQFSAPTDEEKAQPWLWRFWRRLPRLGHIAIFDRSWYGRVLVERVEGFCSEADWRRAYGEINDFERDMTNAGIIVVKFWLVIDKLEQASRFKARQETGYKRYKITDEDWRNREKWDEYSAAVCDMVESTSRNTAPWTLIEANDKYFARVKVLETLCDQIEKCVKKKGGEKR